VREILEGKTGETKLESSSRQQERNLPCAVCEQLQNTKRPFSLRPILLPTPKIFVWQVPTTLSVLGFLPTL